MALLDAISKDMIKVPLSSTDRDGVIGELVSLFSEVKGLSEDRRKEIEDLVASRERLGSTAMENGIAIPHAKVDGLDRAYVLIGIPRLPVPFGDPEGKGTRVFFLVLAPSDNPTEHIQILASIAKACSSQLFMRMLLSSKTKDDVYNLFFE